MAAYQFSLDTLSPSYVVDLQLVGAQGSQGPAGDASTLSWITLATAFSSIPVLTASLVGGDVYTYDYNNDAVSYYRYITPTADSFFTSFDGTNLSGLIADKQTTITL